MRVLPPSVSHSDDHAGEKHGLSSRIVKPTHYRNRVVDQFDCGASSIICNAVNDGM